MVISHLPSYFIPDIGWFLAVRPSGRESTIFQLRELQPAALLPASQPVEKAACKL